MKTAKITFDNDRHVAIVHDFIGFTADWNEILVPVDHATVADLKAAGYEVEFTSNDI